jgi:hypothetical protein
VEAIGREIGAPLINGKTPQPDRESIARDTREEEVAQHRKLFLT